MRRRCERGAPRAADDLPNAAEIFVSQVMRNLWSSIIVGCSIARKSVRVTALRPNHIPPTLAYAHTQEITPAHTCVPVWIFENVRRPQPISLRIFHTGVQGRARRKISLS